MPCTFAVSLTPNPLSVFCINPKILVIYSYCVGTRRRAILDRQQIDKCREILNSDHATNFETRMVAEVNLYWIIYQSCSNLPVDLPKTQAALHEWKQEWRFLFGTKPSSSLPTLILRPISLTCLRSAALPVSPDGVSLCPVGSL